MKIAIDGIPLLTPKTGIGTYTHELAAGLSGLPQRPTVSIVYGVHWLRRLRQLAKRSAEPAATGAAATTAIGDAYRIRWLPQPLKDAAKTLIVRGELALRRPDLLHATNYVSQHLAGPRFDGPTVLTVHDLSFVRYPQTHPAERVQWLETHLQSSIDAAAAIITDSRFTQRELADLMAVDPAKMVSIALGVGAAFHPREAVDIQPTLDRFGLSHKGYLLSVGTIEPRKNITTLVAAFSRLPATLQDRWPLAVVGLKGWKSGATARILDRLKRLGRLRQLGYVPHDRLPSVYAGAGLFAYPSLYEGFGLPPLEAMACGVPVVASNRSSLPEVVGDAGLLVDPEDETALTGALEQLMIDGRLRDRLSQRGRRRAARFTWSACARATYDIYDRVLRGGPVGSDGDSSDGAGR